MRVLFDLIAKLPVSVRDHIYSADLERWYADAQDHWALPDEQRPMIEEAAFAVYLRERTVEQFVDQIREIIEDPTQAKAIAIEILGNDFLKIEDYLGVDIPAYIRSLGGDPTQFVKEISIPEVVAQIVRSSNVTPDDPVLVRRVEHAAVSFLAGVRDRMETVDVLTRSTKVGGVGLAPDVAERFASALEETLRDLRGSGVVLRRATSKSPEDSVFHLVKPATGAMMRPEDEEEIARFRAGDPSDGARSGIAAAVDRVIARSGAKFRNEDVARRFRAAVEARIRDIRDRQETLDLLTRASTAGGLGIAPPQAEKVLAIMEEEFRVLHGRTDSARMQTDSARITDAVRAKRDSGLKSQVSSLPSPTTAITAQLVHPVPPALESEERSIFSAPAIPKRDGEAKKNLSPSQQGENESGPPPPNRGGAGGGGYAPAMQGVALTPHVERLPSIPPPPPPPPTATLVHPVPPLEPQVDVIARPDAEAIPVKQPPAPTIPGEIPGLRSLSRVARGISAPRNDKEEDVRAFPPPAPKPTPVPVPSPEHVEPQPIPPSRPQVLGATPPTPTPPVAPSGRPKVQDIRSVPLRLVGPIEELQRLTIADLRKIAPISADATARIVQKLDLLQRDSYTKRAEGIRALRTSPLMAVYADIMNAALSGKRTAEAEVAARLVEDRNAMTLAEFQELAKLNAQLRG